MHMPEYTHMRHTGIFNPEGAHPKYGLNKDTPITIVGLGNIGSNVLYALIKMGLVNFKLIDDDRVEAHNISSQMFKLQDVGKLKVAAAKEFADYYNPSASITTIVERITPTSETIETDGGILIMAVDSLQSRISVLSSIPFNATVIDGRMGKEQIEVHTNTSQGILENLPSIVSEDSCAEKYISYTAMGIAGLIASQTKKLILGEPYDNTIIFDYTTTFLLKPKQTDYSKTI